MIESDIQKLDPGALVEMFVLDATAIGGSVLRWHSGVGFTGNDMVWAGESYSRLPVEASGFEKSGKGTLPRPKILVANVSGLVGALARSLDDLRGAKVIRKRAFAKYLDAVNFPDGINPQADPNCAFQDEIWFVDRKAGENGVFVEFELSSAFDVRGVKLPRRQCIQNTCPWMYKGAECGYTGGPVADKNDQPTSDPVQDQCGKRLASCRMRFGQYGELPFGGFPGVGLIR
ncbi:phage minor tail protein L [Comamonas aquatica]|uniref:phage minor tail protein L n=1 Tax=Comamonas aquatica TaxID=225991 RepID=UPI00244C316B|nr:phage minor tail protein L [Comamonas aquatica]MDH0899691.1 phage minor tail protein L [Comamonas aquatica]